MLSFVNGGIAELQCRRAERQRFPEYYAKLAAIAIGQVPESGDAMVVTYAPAPGQSLPQSEIPEAQAF